MLAPESGVAKTHRAVWLLSVAALFSAWSWISASLGDDLVWILAALVALFGLPHGALDPLVARAAGCWRSPGELIRHLLAYSALVMAVVLLWWALPLTALFGFLIMSAWHFGDDWPVRPDGQALPGRQRLLLGLGVIGSPVLFHPERVTELFGFLVAATPETAPIDWLVQGWQLLAVAGLLQFAWLAASDLTKDPLWSVELAALALSAWWFEPLVYFAVYFCFLHSPRHLLRAASDREIGLTTRSMAVIGAITFLTIGLGWLAFHVLGNAHPPETRVLQIVFVGLAALTVPHMLLVERYAIRGRRPDRT